MALDKEDHARLVELKEEIKERLDEAQRMVRRHGGMVWERAKSYWVGNISVSLDDESDFIGTAGVSMQDTIDELEPAEEEDEEREIGDGEPGEDIDTDHVDDCPWYEGKPCVCGGKAK